MRRTIIATLLALGLLTAIVASASASAFSRGHQMVSANVTEIYDVGVGPRHVTTVVSGNLVVVQDRDTGTNFRGWITREDVSGSVADVYACGLLRFHQSFGHGLTCGVIHLDEGNDAMSIFLGAYSVGGFVDYGYINVN